MEDQKNASDVQNEERGSNNSDSYDSGRRRRVEGMKVVVCTVVAQVALAGMTVLYKISVDRGMSLRVLVAYCYIFGATLLCPLAFFLERKSRTRLTWVVLGQAFCCSLFGLEKLQMRTPASLAKVIGTLIGMGGAMLLTFCKGARLQFWSLHAHMRCSHY